MFVVFYQKVSCKVMVSSEVISETVYSLCACDALFHIHNYFSHLPLEACWAGTWCLPRARGAGQLLQGRCAAEGRASPEPG